jgi:hypothetical protein
MVKSIENVLATLHRFCGTMINHLRNLMESNLRHDNTDKWQQLELLQPVQRREL